MPFSGPSAVVGERGFALLIGRWRTLQHITTASPSKISDIARAALVSSIPSTAHRLQPVLAVKRLRAHGKGIRRKVFGKTRQEVRDRLKELRQEMSLRG